MKRLRVLISSHEFSPYQGSECAVGWNIATRMAEYHDVTVICADGPALHPNSYRNAVTDYLKQHGKISGLKVVFVEQPPATIRYAKINRKLMSLTRGIGWQLLFYIGLDAWHKEAFRIANSIGLNNFDVVHQLTPISFLKPGYFRTSDLPFFWGPLGGMFKVPFRFAISNGTKSFLFESLRNANIVRQTLTSRSFKNAVRKAERIWTITKDERNIVDRIATYKTYPMIDTSAPLVINGFVRQYDKRRLLKVCWSGQHEPRKALPLLLHAIAGLKEREKIFVDVLGEGPEINRWKKLALRLNLLNINWHGLLPYNEALKAMGESDVFIHTSFREAASMVVLEALGWGLPVICHDACGMALAVNDSCGIKVPFESPERSILGFRQALESILKNPELVEQLSKGALRRASELSWDAKVQEIAEAYTQCAKST